MKKLNFNFVLILLGNLFRKPFIDYFTTIASKSHAQLSEFKVLLKFKL